LVEPEIPQNTGTIGRLCLAVGATLHLVEPMAFKITDAQVKRAGLDYWPSVKVVMHESIEQLLATIPPGAPRAFIEEKSGHTIYDHRFVAGSWLIFGKETAGLPDWILNRFPTETFRIPMYDARVRSLNLSNAVSITVYEALRQLGT